MTVDREQLRRAWRRQCPDVTDAEVTALAAVTLSGPTARTALAAFRAGVRHGVTSRTVAVHAVQPESSRESTS